MFVNDSPAGGLIGFGQRPQCFGDIVVDERWRSRSFQPQEALNQQCNHMLALGEILQQRNRKCRSCSRCLWKAAGGCSRDERR